MAKTYQLTKDEDKDIVIEIDSVEKRRSYEKEWLIKEIARLQFLLDKFK